MKRLSPIRNNKNKNRINSYLAIDDSDDEEKLDLNVPAFETDHKCDDNNTIAQLNLTELNQSGQAVSPPQTPKISNNHRSSTSHRVESDVGSYPIRRLPIGDDGNSVTAEGGVVFVETASLSNPSNSIRIRKNSSNASIGGQSGFGSLYTDGSYTEGGRHRVSNSANSIPFDDLEDPLGDIGQINFVQSAQNRNNFSDKYLTAKSSDSFDDAENALLLAIDRLHEEHLQNNDVDTHSLQSTEYDSVRIRTSDFGTDDDDEYVDNDIDNDLNSRDLDTPSDPSKIIAPKGKSANNFDELGFLQLDTLNSMNSSPSIVSSIDCSASAALSAMEENMKVDGMIYNNGTTQKLIVSSYSSSSDDDDDDVNNGKRPTIKNGDTKTLQDRFDMIAAHAASQSPAAANILVTSGFSTTKAPRSPKAAPNAVERNKNSADKSSPDVKISLTETAGKQQSAIIQQASTSSSEVNIYPAHQRWWEERKVTVIVTTILLFSIIVIILVILLTVVIVDPSDQNPLGKLRINSYNSNTRRNRHLRPNSFKIM